MNGETLIEVKEVSCFYAEHCAVNDISFSVKRGEVLGFLGPNGAGKSSTMQIICGVLAASKGSVSVAGYDIIEQATEAKRHIGFLPETPPLYNDLTVDEYLRYCANLRLLAKGMVENALENCKSRCGLHEYGGRLIGNLSKGYRQRVGIAQAIIHSPAVVILDEPSSGLDPIQILEIRELISELSADHSVIVSTHILPEVQSSCNRVLIINQGKLLLDRQLDSLSEDSGQTGFTVALSRPPLLEELEQVAGINHAQSIDEQRFRLACENYGTSAALVAELAAENDWGLFELIPEHASLEQTFLRITHGDLHQPATDDAQA